VPRKTPNLDMFLAVLICTTCAIYSKETRVVAEVDFGVPGRVAHF
jgi:hypothetical protein